MSLVRGIRSIYQQSHNKNGRAEDFQGEDRNANIILEADYDEECSVKLLNVFPSSISLTARMIPEKNFADVSVERIENSVSFGKNKIYTAPIFNSLSEIKNKNNLCSAIVIKYENSGVFNNKPNCFFGTSFDDYKINFECAGEELQEGVLFKKTFLVLKNSIAENITKISSAKNVHQFYPYGGFFEYGIHPKAIESCLFQIKPENSKSAVRSWSFNRFLLKFNRNPAEDSIMENGDRFVGIKEYSPSQKVSLYDELLGGNCKFTLTNNDSGENQIYKSNFVFHISGTDLIKIDFIKKSETI